MTLPTVDFSDRARRTRAVLADGDIADALVVTDLPNIHWLTGLASSNAAAVVTHDDVIVVTDGRYASQASATGAQLTVIIERSVLKSAVAAAVAAGSRRIAIEADIFTLAQLSALKGAAAFDSVDVVETTGVIGSLRTAKDPYEAAALELACQISVQALATLVEEINVGMTEIEVARRLEQLFGQFGADDRAFPSIVASGPHSAIPHHEPTKRAIEVGDILKIDFGARVSGYHADCTRTFVVGARPSQLQQDVHDAVVAAAAAARSALWVGVEVAELYEIANSVLGAAGLADRFTHGLGHGVGLQIHEAPLIAKGTAGTICDGSVVTIEPGVYLPGQFGVRIEDTCHVTADGTTILTDFPRNLARIA